MHMPLRRLGALLAVATATLVAAPAQAAYTSLTVFGDSLSDTGNIFAITGGTLPVAPYLPGRFSNGPVWVETLAQGLGLPGAAGAVLQNAGLNFAFGGARTGVANNPPGVLAQVGGLWAPSNPTADPNGLYVVVGGGNDMRDARDGASTPASRQAAAAAAASNIAQSVGLLASRGARNVLISTLPDLGNTPEAVFLGLVAESSDATMRYNTLVAGLEPMLETLFPGLDVMVLDMFGIANTVRNDALNNNGATFGITNVTTPCGTFAGSIGISCSTSLFSDALHPSAAAHAILGRAALALVNGVPVPATLALGLAALALLGLQRRRAA